MSSTDSDHLSSGGDTRYSEGRGLWDYRYLIWNFAGRDLKARFNGTGLGWAWSLVVPLSTVLIYSIVFSVIFRATPPDFGNGRQGIYAIWLIVGLVPWNFFLASVTSGMSGLLSAGPLLQKIFIPSYVPVLGTVAGVLVQTLIEFGIVMVLLLFFGNIGWTWLLLPLWLSIFLVFSAATAYVVAVLNVFFRDTGQIVAVLLQFLFFLTPIIYPLSLIEDISKTLETLLLASPIAEFILGFRSILYDLTVPSWQSFTYVTLCSAAMVLVAALVYRRRGKDVGEEI